MLNRRQFVLTSAATAAAFSTTGAKALAATSVRDNVRRYLDPLVARNDYSGFVILERGGRTLLSEGFGFADDIGRIRHSADTHYFSASVGKMFTRAAILSLEKAGKLSRSDAIAPFFPAFPSGSSITVQHLVDHVSGIARDLPPDTNLQQPRSLEQLVATIAAMPIEAKAGATYAYSNNGYRMLARIIEIAGGGEFDPLIRELVLEPKKMRETISAVNAPKGARIALGHQPGRGWNSKEPSMVWDASNFRGAGSFLLTPADMMRFVKTLPLEQKDLDEAPNKDSEGKPKPRSVGHDGFGDGVANLTFAYPDEKAYMVSLSNMQTGAFTPMHADLRKLLFGEVVATPSLPATSEATPAQNLDAYVGDFDLRPGNPVRIRRKGDLLTVDGGDGGHPLIPLGGDRFFMRLRYATLTFPGAAQTAAALRWEEGGGAFDLKRLA